MLKPIRALLFLCVVMFCLQAMAQQNISEGIIKYNAVMEPGEKHRDIFSEYFTAFEFSFSDSMFKMYCKIDNPVITYKPSGNPEKGYIDKYDLMGGHMLFTEPYEEDYAFQMNGIDIGKFKSISYEKKDTKTILGYKCYRANLLLADGSRQVYYITDKIKAPGFKHKGQNISIEGYPLEIHLFEEGTIYKVFKAVEIKPGLPAGTFNIPPWPIGPLGKEPMHKKATAKAPEKNRDTLFVFKSKVLKELYGIAWQLNETNTNAVMLAGAYTLKPDPDNKLVSTYEHDKKRPVYLVTENSDTAYVHILKCLALSQEAKSILEDFEANDIVMVDEQKDKTTTSYYFIKGDYPYMFRFQVGNLASTFMFIYKMGVRK